MVSHQMLRPQRPDQDKTDTVVSRHYFTFCRLEEGLGSADKKITDEHNFFAMKRMDYRFQI